MMEGSKEKENKNFFSLSSSFCLFQRRGKKKRETYADWK
jgi:hypothetical protein